MRPEKDLKEVVDAALAVSAGQTTVQILARDDEESKALWALIKGRRGGKAVTIRIAPPEDFVPLMDRARKLGRTAPEPAPAEAPLDYDGY